MRCRRSERSTSTAATRSSGKGATPPGRKPVASSTSAALATAARRAPMMRATFPVSAFRSPGTSATTGTPSQRRTRDLTICDRVHPIASAAPSAVGVSSGSSSSRASAPTSRRKAATRSTGSGQARVSALIRAPRSGRRRSPSRAAPARAPRWRGVSMENTISASPPSFVRDTAMFAMFTPASPNIEPTRPITPGWSA